MYRVALKNFEGPLDLLLFFIQRDELDIYDIPIGHITEQFLAYIHLMEKLDLDVAGEFILMASRLMAIKARMMIPRKDEQQELDERDPRYELVQRLLEYKRYKEMGLKLEYYAEDARNLHYRGNRTADEVSKQPRQASGEALRDVTMFDLITAFKKVMVDMEKNDVFHQVDKINVTIEQQITFTRDTLRQKGRSSFREICTMLNNRLKIIVTFLAILELLKEQQISLYIQNDDPHSFYIDLRTKEL